MWCRCSYLVQPQGAPAAVTTTGTDPLLTSVGVALDESPPCSMNTELHHGWLPANQLSQGHTQEPRPDPGLIHVSDPLITARMLNK